MLNDRIHFDPAGNSASFYNQGHKHSEEMPKWLFDLGLDAYEYSIGRGVNLSVGKASEIGKEAKKYGIALSVHAPYYINFENENEEAREKSRKYLLDSITAASAMGAKRVVFHPGACKGRDRASALLLTMKEMEIVLHSMLETEGGAPMLCPETMGKPNQQGTLDEVLEICSINSSMLLPAIDFGHINALGGGSLKTKDDYERIINGIENKLGTEVMHRIHIHFSHIEYGKSGEIRHLTLDDKVFGPDFAPLAKILYERAMRPVIICESRDIMAEDALRLKQIYDTACC